MAAGRKIDSAAVGSHNLTRRHLTPTQCATIATKAMPMLQKQARQRMQQGGRQAGGGRPQQGPQKVADPIRSRRERGDARDAASKLTGVGHSYVDQGANAARSVQPARTGVYDRGMKDPKDLPSPPKATGADTLHAVVRAGIGAVPVVGGPALELLARVFSSPIERRRESWSEDVHAAIVDLQTRGVDVSALKDNDDFCDLVLDATGAAMRTHREEKRRALRNAITNAGLRGTAGETKSRVFLRLIDELDVHHLLLLQLLADPAAFLKARDVPFPGPAGDPYTERDALTAHQSPRSLLSIMANVLGDVLPDDLRDIAFDDLVRRGMVDRETKFGTLCIAGKSLASPLGREFVRFIAEPPPA